MEDRKLTSRDAQQLARGAWERTRGWYSIKGFLASCWRRWCTGGKEKPFREGKEFSFGHRPSVGWSPKVKAFSPPRPVGGQKGGEGN